MSCMRAAGHSASTSPVVTDTSTGTEAASCDRLKGGLSRLRSGCAGQSLVEILDQVVWMLESDREAHHVRSDPS